MKTVKNKECFTIVKVYNFICSFLLDKAKGRPIINLQDYATRKTAEITGKPINKVKTTLKLIK